MPVLDLPFDSNTAAQTAQASDALGGLRIRAVSRAEEAASAWDRLRSCARVPFSNPAWARAWYDAHRDAPNVSPLIVVGEAANGEPLFLLPLTQERRGPFTVLVWPGGTHSAYHCGLFSPACRALVTAETAKAFWARVFAELPPADALALYGLPAFEMEQRNPLAHLPVFQCGCASYRMALTPDWEALYASKANAKMRRNDRRCERHLAGLGTLAFRVAPTREERRHMLDCLIAQKSARFAQLGVPNFFDKPHVRSFYEHLIDHGDQDGPNAVMMCALALDEEIIAVNLGMRQGASYHGMVVSMTDGAAERYGPGRLLLRHFVEHLSREGFDTLDFGVGDEPYKDIWSDETVARGDVLVPLNARGWVFVSALKLFLKTKAAIKQSPLLWPLFSRYRRFLGC